MANVALPDVLYTGQVYHIEVDDRDLSQEYRILHTTPTGGWQYPAYSTTGFVEVDTSATHWASIGYQARLPGTTTLTVNAYVGQIPVYSASAVEGLLSPSFDGRLQVKTFDSDISMEASGTAWRAGINSWQELATFVEDKFQAASASLPFTGDEARAFYYMQWVSGFWKYGNQTNPQLPGCVVNNEITGVTDPEDVTVRTFLDSPIGCCTDYTTVLSYLLMTAGIETRAITGLGHVFLEAELDGTWWSVDANLNIAMKAPFDEVLDVNNSVEIYRFDHAGMIDGSAIYRDSLVDFYHTQMQMVEFGRFDQGHRRDALTFYDSLDYGHTFKSALATTGWTGGGQDFAAGIAAPRGYTIGDFDGDGKSDLLKAVSGALGASVQLSTGTGLATATTWSSNATPGDGLVTRAWLVGDFNGDGKDDIFADRGGTASAQVSLSTGTAFATATSWSSVTSGDWGWWAGDFNGDGKSDIMRMVVGVSGADMYLSNGAAFVSDGSWTGAGSGSHRWYVGDFNGDGRDDVAGFQAGSGMMVHLSTGTSFALSGYWTTAGPGSGNWYVGDFDGNGKDDLGKLGTDGTFQTLLSTGTAFAAPVTLATRDLLSIYDLQIGNFDGDLTSDVFFTQTIFNNGGVQALGNTPVFNGLTETEVNRAVAFATARLNLSEIDSPVSAQGAAVNLATIHAIQSLYNAAVATFTPQANAAHFLPFTATVDRVVFFAQWIGGLNLNPVATTVAAALTDQRDKAGLLAAFLEYEAITSNVITAGQATINEVFVDGGWWSINAALGVAFEGRWHDVIDTANDPRGYVFDTAAMTGGSASYSAIVGQLHENFLLRTGTGVGFTFERATAQDWLAAEPGGIGYAPFADMPIASVQATGWSAPQSGGRVWFTGDFNGDGRDDLMSSAGTAGATIALSTGSAFAAGTSWTTASSGNQGWYVGDFNGDGRTDIFAVISGQSGARMSLSNGTTFVDGGSWTGAGSGAQKWYVADFNGDGRDDVLRYVTGVSGAQVMLSTGAQFAAPVSWTGAGQGSGGRWYIGDYDGDGKDDLGRVLNGTGFQVMKSTGATFGGASTWVSGLTSTNRIDVLDANGDGMDDLIVHGSSTVSNRLYLSTGSGFELADWSAFSVSTASLLVGDYNGDGTEDVARFLSSTTAAQVQLTTAVDAAATVNAVAATAETFALADGFGRQTIHDFTTDGANADRIQVADGLAVDYAAIQAAMQQVGLDVVINFGDGDVVTLREVHLSSLSIDNFLF